MAIFEDVKEGGRPHLSISLNSQAQADGVKQIFPVLPSMLHPTVYSNDTSLRARFPTELTSYYNTGAKNGPAYLLRSILNENNSDDS